MSIHCYVGMPGSGKSYNAVENQIIPALRQGRTVVTNIPLKVEAVRKVAGSGVLVEFPLNSVMQNPETIKDYVTKGCLFVLDEAWRIWPAGQKANDIPEVYKSLLAEHRHMVDAKGRSTQIVLIVQDASNIATFARKLVESTFIHTKLSHVGAAGRFRVDIYHGPVTGTIGPKDRRDREIFGTYKPEIWDLYQSHTMSDAAKDGALEAPVDTRHNVLKRPIFVVVIPLVLAVAGFAAYHLVSQGKDLEAKRHEAKLPIADGAQLVHPVEARKTATGNEIYHPQVQVERAVWRVVGFARNDDHPEHSLAVLANGTQRVFRSMDHCRTVDSDFIECDIAGVFYSNIGGSTTGDDTHVVAVSQPLTAVPNQPLDSGGQASAPYGAVAAAPLEEAVPPAHHLPVRK